MNPRSRPTRPRHILMMALALSLLLAGCTGPAADVADTEPGPADGSPITVEHALGTITLDQTPERIVVLEWSYTEALLALGVQPVGVADVEGFETFVGTEPGLSPNVTDVGTRQEPNLETIAGLEPDLIIGVQFRHEQVHETLARIAPTLIFDPWPEQGDQLERMRDTVELVGKATGRAQDATVALAALDARIDRGRSALEAAGVAGDPFVLAQVLAPQYGQFRLFQDHHAAVRIIEQLGLENHWSDAFQLNGFSTVGLEAMEGVEEAHFLYVPGSQASLDRFHGNPAWDDLTFVRQDRTHNLSGAWLLPGPLSGQAFVDLVVAALAGEQGPETIPHAQGETTVEGTPQRVVALEWTYVEDALALGVQPVGVADVDGYGRWVAAGAPLAETVTDVGTRQEPSLEIVASLEPDLIIGVQFRHEPIYDKLSSIAPTLLFDPYPGEQGPDQYTEMVETFTAIADALDREDRAQQVLAALEETLTQAREQVSNGTLADDRVVLAQAFSYEGAPTLRLFTDNALAIQLLQRTGLENAWSDGFQPYGFSTVTIEALERAQDARFLYVAQPDDDPVRSAWSDDPAWQNLTFVQQDRVHALGGDVWLFGGPRSAQHAVNATIAVLSE